jgi:hypothetical protein
MSSLFLSAWTLGSDVGSRDALRRVVEGSKKFGSVNDGEGGVPIGAVGSILVVDQVSLIGACFLMIEGEAPRIFVIASITDQTVTARELAPKLAPSAPVAAAANPLMGLAMLASQQNTQATAGSQGDTDPARPEPSGVGGGAPGAVQRPPLETLRFDVAGLEALWLAGPHLMEKLEALVECPEVVVSAEIALAANREPVVKLWRHGNSGAERTLLVSLKVKQSGGGGIISTGTGVEGVLEKERAMWNVPMPARGMFELAEQHTLFEGKERILGVRLLYGSCMLQGGNSLSVGDDRFNVNLSLLLHLPHGELQDLLKFRFPGLKFFQTCGSEDLFGEYMIGSKKADTVPRIFKGRVALEALDNLIVLLQRVFSAFTPAWAKAWYKLQTDCVALTKAKTLPGMEFNGLLCAVLDRVLVGFFQQLSKPTVTHLEVLQAQAMLAFDFDSITIDKLNSTLAKQERDRKLPEPAIVGGAKRPREGIKERGCFAFFTEGAVCAAGAACTFSHDIGTLSLGEVVKLRKQLVDDGKQPVAALL